MALELSFAHCLLLIPFLNVMKLLIGPFFLRAGFCEAWQDARTSSTVGVFAHPPAPKPGIGVTAAAAAVGPFAAYVLRALASHVTSAEGSRKSLLLWSLPAATSGGCAPPPRCRPLPSSAALALTSLLLRLIRALSLFLVLSLSLALSLSLPACSSSKCV